MSTNKNSKKSSSKKSGSTVHPSSKNPSPVQVSSNLLGAALPPTVRAPQPPDGVDLTLGVGRGGGVWPTLAGLAGTIAAEVRASPTFAEDFGSKVDPNALAQSLEHAAAWRDEWTRANNWLAYTRIGHNVAWRVSRKQLERFRLAFEHATACDPTIATRYPQLTELYRAQSAAGARASETRKRNKPAKQPVVAAPPPQEAAPAAPPAQAAPPAAPAQPPAATPPATTAS